MLPLGILKQGARIRGENEKSLLPRRELGSRNTKCLTQFYTQVMKNISINPRILLFGGDKA